MIVSNLFAALNKTEVLFLAEKQKTDKDVQWSS